MIKHKPFHFRKVNKLWSCTIYFEHGEVFIVEAKAKTWRAAGWSAKLKLIDTVYRNEEDLRDLLTENAIAFIQRGH